jgi:hypothetical protein
VREKIAKKVLAHKMNEDRLINHITNILISDKIPDMQPDLPEAYYLDNVTTLFEHVESLYADILEQRQLEFLHRFAALPENAKKLYIRLLNRSHQLFRLSKLNYPEILDIDQAIKRLENSSFLQVNPDIEYEALIALFNKSELLSHHPDHSSLRKLNRTALDTALLEQPEQCFIKQLTQSDCFLQVEQKESYKLCQMLFFGNLNQSMTDFVLRDLGLNQYEKYPIDIHNRPYTSSLEIQQHWLLYEIDCLFDLADPADTASLQKCFAAIPADIDPASPIFRKGERIKYEIARQLERLQDIPLALELYRQCSLPPSRERITRILDKQGQAEQAIAHCRVIIEQPWNEEESQFALAFGQRLVQRHKLEDQPLFASSPVVKPKMLKLELEQQDSVELAVVDYFLAEDAGNQCFYLENSLFNGVLGLLIWDVVFAPVAGAFYNPFQYRPADFYAFDFLQKRTSQIENSWRSISCNEDIWRQVFHCWQTKFGRMNPLVNWQTLDLEIIELALQRIAYPHWMRIFERILLDLRNNRAGFPDLVLFPANGGYQLVEVKGPGDSLQKNQQRWMQYFSEHKVPHCVAWVQWQISDD